MSIVFEVIIYLILVFGIMITTIAFCDNSLNNKERYIRIKKDDSSVKVKVEIDGIDDKDKKIILDIIEKGWFESIYDVADEYVVENKS